VGTLLESGDSVRVLDSLMYGDRSLSWLKRHSALEFVHGDIRDTRLLRDAVRGVDGIVHLAAIVGDPACARNRSVALAVNQQASSDLLSAARAEGVGRFVFASTCSNYGRMADTSTLATEDHELKPVSLYAETKVAVERLLLGLPASDMTATVLRFATLYGMSPRMRFDLTVNEFVREMLVRRRLVVYGEQFWRPYVHVHDAARAVAAAMNASSRVVAGQVFNVGRTDENYRKLDLLSLIRDRVGEADVQMVSRTEDPRDYKVSFERIADRLGYMPSRRVPDGIDEIATAIESGAFENVDDPDYSNMSREPQHFESASRREAGAS
jgi:nucleoside-diphosphate-sugar epimerase